jgi:hypothetical protein
MASLNYCGLLDEKAFLDSELMHRGFTNLNALRAMMVDTNIVLGGGLATHELLRQFGHHYDIGDLPAESDLDFYVYGCLPPSAPPAEEYHGGPGVMFRSAAAAKYDADCRVAAAFKRHVHGEFTKCVVAAGYSQVWEMEDIQSYETERTTAGDRFLTTGSQIRYSVLFFRRTTPGGRTQTINLVYVNAPLQTVMTKVDIGLTAGFLTTSISGYWSYHHAAPQDLVAKRVAWLQPESTHTPRQQARLAKYCARYRVLPSFTLTAAQFLAQYDDLPDECNIVLQVKESEKTTALLRRVRGLATAVIVFRSIPEVATDPASAP